MQTVSAAEAVAGIADLLAKVEEGEIVVVARDGMPIVQMTRFKAPGDREVLSRKEGLGLFRGLSTIADDIKSPFAEEISRMFYGEPDTLGS